jgi:hypothetical protein
LQKKVQFDYLIFVLSGNKNGLVIPWLKDKKFDFNVITETSTYI